MESKVVRHDYRGMPEPSSKTLLPNSLRLERFTRNFEACETGWKLRQEPACFLPGQEVLTPHLSFQKYGLKVCLEIIGHVSPDELERKLQAQSMIRYPDIIFAVNELSRTCQQEPLQSKRLFYYMNELPLRPVLEYLKEKETAAIPDQVDELINKRIRLQGDIVSVGELASYYNVSPESVDRIFENHIPIGYRRLGDYYVSIQLAEVMTDEIGRSGNSSLTNALGAIERHGFNHPERVLEDLGYSVIWNCLSNQNTRIL